MTNLPVIVGFGGYNAAGRSSFHHSYRRTILESINQSDQVSTLAGLACLMKLVTFQNGVYINSENQQFATADEVAQKYRAYILENTLVRRIDEEHFDANNVLSFKNVQLRDIKDFTFTLSKKDLPNPLPDNWSIKNIDDKTVMVSVNGDLSCKIESFRALEVQAAGQLPKGFNIAEHYNSRFHPRGLQMSVLAASDALNSTGIPWDKIANSVDPDEVSVYATSSMGQNDEYGNRGIFQARLKSSRPSSKQCPFSFTSMPADFVNAYVCGNVGTTGSMAGACASFLYNLRLGVADITSGSKRVVIVGSSEAPILPEIIEGYAAMGALATNEKLKKLDQSDTVNYNSASRPFGNNCGFTLGESAQYFVLMDDKLALELGAEIYGAVNDVFVNADGFKKSISSPGAGNYITLSKAVASARAILGDESIQHRSFIQAHGSSTPQNRVTESMIFDKVAQGFGISNWPVTAVKAFLGHPLASASGDQLSNTLGVFNDGIIPGIRTTKKIADDVASSRLDICLTDKKASIDVAFLNSKGFGGNNATASILSPKVVKKMLEKRYGSEKIAQYTTKNKQVKATANSYNEQANNGQLNVIYHFGENIIDEEKISISNQKITLPNFENEINLEIGNPYSDMC